MLLVTTGHPDVAERYKHDHLGRLVQPRHYSSIEATAASSIPWAADNDAFIKFDETAFRNMLARLRGLLGCLFVAAPDVVGDAAATLELFGEWKRIIHAHGLPCALVAQDGLTPETTPWQSFEALFVGGSTEWKLGEQAERLVEEAKRRGKHVHMGRVNSRKRIRYAAEIGCDSVDGTSYACWKQVHLRRGLRDVEHASNDPMQLRLGGTT